MKHTESNNASNIYNYIEPAGDQMITIITICLSRDSLKNKDFYTSSFTEEQELGDTIDINSYYQPFIELLALIIKDGVV